MTKIDEKHKDFIGKVLCSKGIGAALGAKVGKTGIQ